MIEKERKEERELKQQSFKWRFINTDKYWLRFFSQSYLQDINIILSSPV